MKKKTIFRLLIFFIFLTLFSSLTLFSGLDLIPGRQVIVYAEGEGSTSQGYKPDTFLLNSKWSFYYPFNKFFPKINGNHLQPRPVHVAVAQLMRYHHHPLSGYGVVSSTWNDQVVRSILFKEYHWENMPDFIDYLTPEYKIDEVSRFIRDLAIAGQTKYGPGESNIIMQNLINAMINNFGYDKEIKNMTNQDNDLFFNTIKKEIDALRPVLVLLPGAHAAIADGYSSDQNSRKIHLNFGWAYYSNDYYSIDEPIKAYPYTFSTDPGALTIYYNIKPSEKTNYPTLESEDNIQGLNINAKFDTDRDIDEYTVYMKGSTSLTVSRGHRLQLFFVSIYDPKGNLIAQNNPQDPSGVPAIFVNLPADKYMIKISPCNETGCYIDKNLNNYTVSINTGSLTEEEKKSIDLKNDLPPAIANTLEETLLINLLNGPYKILIEAADENGDTVLLSAFSTNSQGVEVCIEENNILSIIPKENKAVSKITILATSAHKTVAKSFNVLVINEDIKCGREFEVSGLFEDGSILDKHRVVLDGKTTITGYSYGLSTQSFFSSVINPMTGKYLIPPSQPEGSEISSNFSANQYFLGASLTNQVDRDYYIPYQKGYGDIYALEVSCPEADTNIFTIAEILGVEIDPQQLNAGDDSLEPNDTSEQATLLSPQMITSCYGVVEYPELICLNDDWYSLHPSYPATLTADIQFQHGDLNLELYDLSLNRLGTASLSVLDSSTADSGSSVIKTLRAELEKGDYWLKVSGSTVGIAIDYSLMIQEEFKIEDKISPQIICPQEMVVEAITKESTKVTYQQVKVSDNCDPAPSVTYNPPDGSSFAFGERTVNCQAKDAAGNKASCSFKVKIVDTTPPRAKGKDIMVELLNAKNGVAVITPEQINDGSSDNCGLAEMKLSQDRFTCDHVGENVVTLRVKDPSGNEGTCQVIVTVEDKTNPSITCPADVSLPSGKSIPLEQVSLGKPMVSDLCDSSEEITDNITKNAPTEFKFGKNQVIWTASDKNGNSSSCTQVVTVVDQRPSPAIEKPISPIDMDINQNLSVTLSWPKVPLAESYQIYFGLDSNLSERDLQGAVTATEYTIPYSLAAGTTYYWRIVATNKYGQTPSAAIWWFKTIPKPQEPKDPKPNDGAIRQGLQPAFTWFKDPTAKSYQIYLGQGSNTLEFLEEVTEALYTYKLTSLKPDTTYYWQIIAKNAAGETKGPVWSFKTGNDITPPDIFCPSNIHLAQPESSAGISKNDWQIKDFLAKAWAIDKVDGPVLVNNDAPPVFPRGETVVTFIASDRSGNKAQCEATVTVGPKPPENIGQIGRLSDLARYAPYYDQGDWEDLIRSYQPDYKIYEHPKVISQKIDYKWASDKIGEPILSSPVVVERKVLVGSGQDTGGSGSVWCWEAANGEFNWQKKFDWPVISSPCVYNGSIYVADQNGTIYSLNQWDGKENWSYPANSTITSSPLIATLRVSALEEKDFIYLADDSGMVYCLGTDGQLKWDRQISGAIEKASPALGDGGGGKCLFIGNTKGDLYFLNALTGQDLFSPYPTGTTIKATPCVSSKRAFIGNEAGKVFCLDTETGKSVWKVDVDGAVGNGLGLFGDNLYVATKTGYIYRFNSLNGRKIWGGKQKIGLGFLSSPVICDDYIYIGNKDNYVYCFDALSGKKISEFKTEGQVLSSPAVSDGKVYIGSNDSRLYCLAAMTKGQGDWPMYGHDPKRSGSTQRTIVDQRQVNLKQGVFSSPIFGGGYVYVGGLSGKLYCLDPENLATKWEFSTGGPIISSPSFAILTDPATGNKIEVVYVGSEDGRLYCLNTKTYEERWSYPTEDKVVSSPTPTGDRVYVGSYDGYLYCLDALSGSFIWQTDLSTPLDSSPTIGKDGYIYIGSDKGLYCLEPGKGKIVSQYQAGTSIVTTAAYQDNILCYGDREGNFTALSTQEGKSKWGVPFDYPVFSSAALSTSLVYMASLDGSVFGVNMKGEKQWSFYLPGIVTSSPAFYGKYLYLGAWDNRLYCLDGTSGRQVFVVEAKDKILASPAVANGWVYVADISGNVYRLKAEGVEGQGATDWPLFRQNPGHTGSVYSRTCLELNTGVLDIEDSSGASGEMVEVPVRIQGATKNVSGFSFEVTYPYEELQYQGFGKSDLSGALDFFNVYLLQPGLLKITGEAIGATPITNGTSKTLVKLQFNIISAKEDENNCIPLKIQVLEGDIDSFPATGGCVCLQKKLKGDVNGDGVISAADALMVFQCCLRLITPCPDGCDVNGDGVVSASDALCIFQKCLLLPSCLN